MSEYVAKLISEVKVKNPNEPEFHQAVQEILESLEVVLRSSSGISCRKNIGTNGGAGTRYNIPRPVDG